MGRIALAFRYFWHILMNGEPPAAKAAPVVAPATPLPRPEDGALQMLAILQRDSRIIDFLMEDITAYDDEQVGAAVRSLHDQCRDSLLRYLRLAPVIDGVEGTFTRVPAASQSPALVKFIGNVPAQPPQAGTLRHKGWRAEKIDLPKLAGPDEAAVIAPAEIEIE